MGCGAEPTLSASKEPASQDYERKTSDGDTMQADTVNYTKGETPMTDLQFNAYVELRNKYDELLQEADKMRRVAPRSSDDGMTDYQFRRYEKLRDKCEELDRELALLREENAKLKIQLEMSKALPKTTKGSRA